MEEKNSEFYTEITIFVMMFLLAFGAVGGVPYAFYVFLRYVVFAGSIYTIFGLYTNNKNKLIYPIFFASAIIFNPIIPIHLTREIWIVIDLLAIGFMYGSLHMLDNDFDKPK